jgi:four helix bundle protein
MEYRPIKSDIMAFKFEKLQVWQKALELTQKVDNITKSVPRSELFVLTPQIKRAADSVALNIAEGSTGQTNAEFSKFLGYAVRSAIEVVGCVFIAKKRNLIDEIIFADLYNELSGLIKGIQALRNSLDKPISSSIIN